MRKINAFLATKLVLIYLTQTLLFIYALIINKSKKAQQNSPTKTTSGATSPPAKVTTTTPTSPPSNSGSSKTDSKPVECNLCHRKFKNIPALNGHMRLHGGYFKKVPPPFCSVNIIVIIMKI